MDHLQRFYEKKRVLVTGGAGFIGSHLAERLVQLGARVTILDNFSSGKLANLKNVAHAITILYADIRATYSCVKATSNQDIVFHLASFVSVPESLKNPELCYATNLNGTTNLLDACKKNNVKTFIFSSSSAVYGNKNGLCGEEDIPSPLSPYASSKNESEQTCMQFAHLYNMNIASLRYFNVYGDRQNPHGSYAAVVAKFTHQLLQGQPLTIFGDGKQTRDFVHVSKAVDANLNLGIRSDLHGDIFNVASGKSVSLLQLIEQLEAELQIKRTEIVFQPARDGDILHSQANCQKYQKMVQSGG